MWRFCLVMKVCKRRVIWEAGSEFLFSSAICRLSSNCWWGNRVGLQGSCAQPEVTILYWVEALVPTELGRAKAKRVLSRERTGHRKHPFPTTQEMTLHIDITKWSILKSDWLYSLQLKMEKKKQSAKTRSGADCDSDHELLIEKFRLNWRK